MQRNHLIELSNNFSMRMKFAARDRVFTLLYKGKELGFTFCDPLNGLGNCQTRRTEMGHYQWVTPTARG